MLCYQCPSFDPKHIFSGTTDVSHLIFSVQPLLKVLYHAYWFYTLKHMNFLLTDLQAS